MIKINGWDKFLKAIHVVPQKNEKIIENDALFEELIHARKEWQNAQQFFSNVSDADLIDYAITLCRAAEQRYMYLLRMAKQEGLVNNNISIS